MEFTLATGLWSRSGCLSNVIVAKAADWRGEIKLIEAQQVRL